MAFPTVTFTQITYFEKNMLITIEKSFSIWTSRKNVDFTTKLHEDNLIPSFVHYERTDAVLDRVILIRDDN